MLFYFIHEFVMNGSNLTKDWSESKKNCLTFLIGGNLHLVLFLIVQYMAKSTKNALIELFYRFYAVFIIIDILTMAILYKCYWGRSILNEMESEGKWHFDEENHQYTLRRDYNKNIRADHINEFFNKGEQLEEVANQVDQIKRQMYQDDQPNTYYQEQYSSQPDQTKQEFKHYQKLEHDQETKDDQENQEQNNQEQDNQQQEQDNQEQDNQQELSEQQQELSEQQLELDEQEKELT